MKKELWLDAEYASTLTVDGDLIGTDYDANCVRINTATDDNPSVGDNSNHIGGHNYFIGDINEIVVYRNALTEPQIQEIFLEREIS